MYMWSLLAFPGLQGERADRRSRDKLQFGSEGGLLAEFFLAQGRLVFILLKPSTD